MTNPFAMLKAQMTMRQGRLGCAFYSYPEVHLKALINKDLGLLQIFSFCGDIFGLNIILPPKHFKMQGKESSPAISRR